MNTKSMASRKSKNASASDKLLEDLRLVVLATEERLYKAASQSGEGSDAVRARIRQDLRTVKARLFAAETTVSESAVRKIEIDETYCHDNPWKSICISACANLIIGIQNTSRY